MKTTKFQLLIPLLMISVAQATENDFSEVKENKVKTRISEKKTSIQKGKDADVITEEVKTKDKVETTTTDDFGGYGKPLGVAGPITFGPQLTLAAFPTTFRVGIESKYANLIGLGVEYGFIPGLTLSNVNLSLNSIQGSAKFYPFRGAFHVGFALGNQTFSASTKTTVGGIPATLTGNANTLFITPTIGWKWVKQSGLYFGLDLGWQAVLSTNPTITSDQLALTAIAETTTEGRQLKDNLNTLAKTGLPSVCLLQIGYFF